MKLMSESYLKKLYSKCYRASRAQKKKKTLKAGAPMKLLNNCSRSTK
jgi:hypothetical protein